jgi:Superfamily I DNA and RNA helicases
MGKKLIIGSPGTGKTTMLLNLVEQKMREGVSPNRIAFVSFTRAAVNEAMTRARARFGTAKKDHPWFRTLHSTAYRLLDVTPADLMTADDYELIGEALGIDFTANSGRHDTLPRPQRRRPRAVCTIPGPVAGGKSTGAAQANRARLALGARE